ncbi:hypothetical protein [Streptomyces agglomeratus]|uniref:hypothetical protein n=1 Tax=Streptomyces agglomeratus TaxID=285458 RepID=UPI00159F0BE7|nr:hypothetical protein [Streptomyces agglomeratus]
MALTARSTCPASRLRRDVRYWFQAQADTTGFVVRQRWAETIEQHFQPQLPDLDHTSD